jgi:hypothetical protein
MSNYKPQITRTIEHNGEPLVLVNYPIIPMKLMDEFFKKYKEITGESDILSVLPPWFFFEGPQNRSNVPDGFETDCIRIVGPGHYFKMYKLYQDIINFNSSELRTINKAYEIYGKIYEFDFNSLI